jgi:hypothetical protein
MNIRYGDGLGQAAPPATIYNSDNRLVKLVTPADMCGGWPTGRNLKTLGRPKITHVVIHALIGFPATTIQPSARKPVHYQSKVQRNKLRLSMWWVTGCRPNPSSVLTKSGFKEKQQCI